MGVWAVRNGGMCRTDILDMELVRTQQLEMGLGEKNLLLIVKLFCASFYTEL